MLVSLLLAPLLATYEVAYQVVRIRNSFQHLLGGGSEQIMDCAVCLGEPDIN